MPDAAYKPCSRCRETKPLDEFYRRSDRLDGWSSQCRSCIYWSARFPRVEVGWPCACGCGAAVYTNWGRPRRFASGHYLRANIPNLRQAGHRRSAEEIAWAAGIFEGEGCFTTQRRRNGSLLYAQASMNMTDLDIMERFHQVVGVGVLRGPEMRKTGKPRWVWCTGRHQDVATVGLLFAPWLGERRLVRAASVLAVDTRRRTA